MVILLMYGKEMVLAEEFKTGVEIPLEPEMPDNTFNITFIVNQTILKFNPNKLFYNQFNINKLSASIFTIQCKYRF